MKLLLAVFAGVVLIYVTRFIISIILNKNRNKNEKRLMLQIKVSKSNEKTAKASEAIYSAISSTIIKDSFINWIICKKSPSFSFEIACINKHVYFYCYCNEQYKDMITSQLYSQYPDIEIEIVNDYLSNFSKKDLGNVYAEIETDNSYIYPIKRHPQFEDNNSKIFLDPLSSITGSFSSLAKNDLLAVQIVISPIGTIFRQRGLWVSDKIKGGFNINSNKYQTWYTNMLLSLGIKKVFNLLFVRPLLFILGLGAKSLDENRLKQADEVEQSHKKETVENAISGKLSQQLFGVNIRFLYIGKKSDIESGNNKIKNLISSFYQFNIPRFNSFRIKKINKNLPSSLKIFKNRKIDKSFILNIEELSTIWHLPSISVEVPNIQWIKSKLLEPPLNLPTQGEIDPDKLTLLGYTNFRGEKIKFGIKEDDRRRHVYIIGKTGMGKTTMLENMIVSDINNGKGVAVIDPHGDLSENILNLIPKSRTNDVMIFNPADADYPISFNMLECKSPEHRQLIASGLLGVFKKMFGDSWGPRLQHILRNTLLALTERKDSTLLGIMKMLSDQKYRNKVISSVKDPMVLSFWNDEFGKWDARTIAENVSPIQNKVGQFLSSKLIRNIFGQPISSVNLRFAMDNKKIIIINISKGKIGEDNSSLLGSMLITKFQIDAMSRADIPEKSRNDFYLYVDEFQNFATDSFATILSEARKYRLNLTMANQYIDQMTDDVKSAIFGNVGSLISYQVGAEDADILVKQFSDLVLNSDLINIPKYNCYMKLMTDGMPSSTFSIKSLEPKNEVGETAKKEIILKVSREKHAKNRKFVESKIEKWMSSPK